MNDEGDIVPTWNLTREELDNLDNPDAPYNYKPPTKEESIAKIRKLTKRINESNKPR